jgi:hypothetical protein
MIWRSHLVDFKGHSGFVGQAKLRVKSWSCGIVSPQDVNSFEMRMPG